MQFQSQNLKRKFITFKEEDHFLGPASHDFNSQEMLPISSTLESASHKSSQNINKTRLDFPNPQTSYNPNQDKTVNVQNFKGLYNIHKCTLQKLTESSTASTSSQLNQSKSKSNVQMVEQSSIASQVKTETLEQIEREFLNPNLTRVIRDSQLQSVRLGVDSGGDGECANRKGGVGKQANNKRNKNQHLKQQSCLLQDSNLQTQSHVGGEQEDYRSSLKFDQFLDKFQKQSNLSNRKNNAASVFYFNYILKKQIEQQQQEQKRQQEEEKQKQEQELQKQKKIKETMAQLRKSQELLGLITQKYSAKSEKKNDQNIKLQNETDFLQRSCEEDSCDQRSNANHKQQQSFVAPTNLFKYYAGFKSKSKLLIQELFPNINNKQQQQINIQDAATEQQRLLTDGAYCDRNHGNGHGEQGQTLRLSPYKFTNTFQSLENFKKASQPSLQPKLYYMEKPQYQQQIPQQTTLQGYNWPMVQNTQPPPPKKNKSLTLNKQKFLF